MAAMLCRGGEGSEGSGGECSGISVSGGSDGSVSGGEGSVSGGSGGGGGGSGISVSGGSDGSVSGGEGSGGGEGSVSGGSGISVSGGSGGGGSVSGGGVSGGSDGSDGSVSGGEGSGGECSGGGEGSGGGGISGGSGISVSGGEGSVSFFQVDADFTCQAEASLAALPVCKQQVSEYWKTKYELEHVKNWDIFYKNNKINFFKDRHYLEREFELKFPIDRQVTFVDLGCGVGNALVPLVQRHPNLTGIGFDCSAVAIALLNARDPSLISRCRGFVLDMTTEIQTNFTEFQALIGTCDYVSLIFSLSACHPKAHKAVVANAIKLLKPGGLVLFRDYAKYDLAQLRFAEKQARLDEDFYVRGDGTKAKFFTEDEVKALFASHEALENLQLKIQSKKFVNRKDNLHMYRLWIQAVWIKKGFQVSQ